jgi:hypothetical protein
MTNQGDTMKTMTENPADNRTAEEKLRERNILKLARLMDCDPAMLREKIEADMAKLAALKRGRA